MGGALRAVARAAVLAGALCWPGLAEAHSLVRQEGSEVSYLSADATSLNQLTVRATGSDVDLRDPTVDGGMDFGNCRPGEVNDDGDVIQALCPARGVSLLRIDLGEREDVLDVRLEGVPVRVLGGNGADRLRTAGAADLIVAGPGDDGVVSGAGNDQIVGNDGFDGIDAGPGDDLIKTRDGLRDVIICGDGTDIAEADEQDEIPASAGCETVDRVATASPAGANDGDVVPPELAVGGRTTQAVGRTRRVSVLARSGEAGTIAASGWLTIAGRRFELSTRSRTVRVGGGGVKLVFRFPKPRMVAILRALQRSRRVTVRLGIVATDRAGNSTQAAAPRIRLKR